LQDAQNLVLWAHTVKLPSWEPAFEQNLDGAISHLQSAKAAWDQLSTSADANKGTFLAFGSQETTAGLASLDQALRSMGGAVPASDGKCFGSQAYAPNEITHACWR
jgi:hypothetical protein